MKSHRSYLIAPLLLALAAPAARAEKEVTIRRLDVDAPRHIEVHDDDDAPKEKIAFLGVETVEASRTIAAQLGLPRDTGLVVTRVVEKGPSVDVLKEDDVLTKFDDQILIDMHQLGVLVRSHKEGDEVKLTLVRGGKETVVKARLGSHEVPRRGNAFFFRQGGEGHGFGFQTLPGGDLGDLARLREIPGIEPGEARDLLRIIGREHGQFLGGGPGVHVLHRAGKGATILDLPKSNITYSDDQGAIEIKSDDDKRSLTVKDAKGSVLFSGPVTTEEERRKVPPEVMKRLEKLDTDSLDVDPGQDFKTEVVPLPPSPDRTDFRPVTRRGPEPSHPI